MHNNKSYYVTSRGQKSWSRNKPLPFAIVCWEHTFFFTQPKLSATSRQLWLQEYSRNKVWESTRPSIIVNTTWQDAYWAWLCLQAEMTGIKCVADIQMNIWHARGRSAVHAVLWIWQADSLSAWVWCENRYRQLSLSALGESEMFKCRRNRIPLFHFE